ncbi:MAG: hypothetical protein ACK5Q5_14295 [Planctomycetaceae bacterium]
MPPEQIVIGGMTAAMCLAGLLKETWLLEQTRKGQRLTQWCGVAAAPWVLRGLLMIGVGFGLALATGVINPLRFDGVSRDPVRLMQRR